ncbi:MAG TPA: hypothetical protein VMT00_04410 [Thermoanaerobaculia bacterium]|nr:hypothetical protein [Thermoanaerobaculia bacterium]
MTLRRIIICAFLALLSAFPLPASTVHETKQMGEPRPDKALVYVIREKAFVGGGVGIFVFADEQLIAFVRNNTYGFGYVEPGEHLLWGDTPSGLDVHFVAGETYYVAARPVNPISLMTEAEGKQAIERVASYIESDQADLDNAAKKVAKRYEKVQRREAKKEKADVEQVSVAAPASTEGKVTLAANTKLSIELMENLSSSLNRLGETVWFRVADEIVAGDGVVIPKGSRVKAAIRQVKPGSSFGEQGVIDIALVSVDLDDATRVPLVGQLAAAGEERAAGVMTGLVVGAFIRGTEAFYPVGTMFSAWTREDVWLRPTGSVTAPVHTGVTAPALDLAFGENTRRNPPPVELSFPCGGAVTDVQLVSAGDWQLPESVRPLSVTRSGDICAARFDGWSVLRYVQPSDTPRPLHLHATSGEAELHVDVPARIRLQ